MNNSSTYEKIVKPENKGKYLAKRISAVMAYALFFAVWLVAALHDPKKFVLILAAGVLCTVLAVVLTWKYLMVEYEYSFWYGTMSVARIYAKRKRKTVVEAEMKELLIVAPATEEYIRRAEGFEPEETVMAISSESAEDIWLTVTGGKDKKRILIFFEADERSLSMLRSSAPFAFVKKI